MLFEVILVFALITIFLLIITIIMFLYLILSGQADDLGKAILNKFFEEDPSEYNDDEHEK